MARRPRLLAPGFLYHVIVRDNQRQQIFVSERDYYAYLERFATCHRYDITPPAPGATGDLFTRVNLTGRQVVWSAYHAPGVTCGRGKRNWRNRDAEMGQAGEEDVLTLLPVPP